MRIALCLLLLIAAGEPRLWSAQGPPQALPPGEEFRDSRLEPLKDLDGHFPFKAPGSLEEWEKRAEQVKRRILVSQGLWPMPRKTPLRPAVHGKLEFPEYTVEKVYLESFPGFFLTGNLYRPRGKAGPFPGVLCPHGHWSEGRFTDDSRVREAIARGAERFESGGRSPLQSRCVQLARMGCVVFHYDMIGYADSVQISYQLAHRFAQERPEMNQGESWGLYTPRAESHLQSVMGLQTWNSIRALDFLEALPDVDKGRLAITGASGGGTQTFMLAAIDPRLSCAFPAVMVGTAMQGGCTCENASLLRVGTGNVEISALFAPRPLGLTGADDWTRDMATDGFPQLQALYRLLGHGDSVMLEALNHFGHNYNAVSRGAMYRWFNRHLELGESEPILERDYDLLSREQMSVWDEQHPRPEGGEEFERKLLAHWHRDASRQLEEWLEEPGEFARRAAPALEVIAGRTLESAGEVEWALNHKEDKGSHLEMAGLLENATYGESVPIVFLYPDSWKGHTALVPLPRGKDGLYGSDGRLRPEVERLLDGGFSVAAPDLFLQGESLADGQSDSPTRRVDNPRQAAAYTLGYNHSLFAQRIHDLLTCIRYIRGHERQSGRLVLAGVLGAGHWAAVARCVAGDALDACAIDTQGFRFEEVDGIRHPDFLPGGARYLDLPGFLLAAPPGPLWISGEPAPVQAMLARRHLEDPGALAFGNPGQGTEAAVDWILR